MEDMIIVELTKTAAVWLVFIIAILIVVVSTLGFWFGMKTGTEMGAKNV